MSDCMGSLGRRGHPSSSTAWSQASEKLLMWARDSPLYCVNCAWGLHRTVVLGALTPVCPSLLTSLTLHFLSDLSYNLTADVAQKEKGQLPRVYFVLLGETAGQVSEKLQLTSMEETCHHYLAHVKVSFPPVFNPQIWSLRIVIWTECELRMFHCAGSDFHNPSS